MRTLGLFALSTSVVALACGAANDGQSGAGLQGAGGALGGGPSMFPGSGASPAVTGPGGGPAGFAGTPVGAAGAVTGQAGAPIGGAPSGGAPNGGAPNGGAPSGGAPSGGASGAGGAPVVDPPGTVTLKTDSFQLAPGQEVYKCQNWDNPFQGKDTPVFQISTDMAKGSHHLHVYNLTEGTGRTLEDCTISDFHALVHAAGSPHAETTYADGMATKIKGSSGLRMQLHYLNTTLDTLTVGATLKLSPAANPASITKWVAQLYFNRGQLSVPPGMGVTVQTTCSIPNTYGMIGLVGGGTHMHTRGIREVATTSTGAMLADANTWDEPPPVAYNPPIMMNPGDSITWTCTYNNMTANTYTFGPSVSDNEMCIYLARYYSSNANDTQIACQAQSPNGGTAQPMPY